MNPSQVLVEKALNVAKLKLPFILPIATIPSIGHRQGGNSFLALRVTRWETKVKSTSALVCTCSMRDLVACTSTETKNQLIVPPALAISSSAMALLFK